MGDRLEKWAGWLDRRAAVVLVILAVVYVFHIWPSVNRHLWFDELYTFYIAQASSIPLLLKETSLMDRHPPLSFFLVRASLAALGNTELAARLPMILGFFIGSAGMFAFIARRAGSLWAAAGVGLFWYGPFFYFATESRPYGVLFGSMGLMLLCWDPAIEGRRRGWALAGLAAGNAGMILSHIYAPLWVVPFWAAELTRQWRTRKIDWPLWCALILPMALVVSYIPLLRNSGDFIPPPVLEGSALKAVWFYRRTFLQVAIPLIGSLILGLGVVSWRRSTGSPEVAGFRSGDLALLLVSLLPPALIHLVGAQRHIAVYDRHVILSVVTACILLILVLAFECRTDRLAGGLAAILVLTLVLLPLQRLLRPAPPREPHKTDFQHVQPDLPFVTNSALTFLEMDRYEDPALVARMYYLVDFKSAIQYDHSNLTEILSTMKQYFPIRANVLPYTEFVATHRKFLVWGVMDQSGWLLLKLKTEGAQLTEIGTFDTVYPDPQLFEVNMDP